MNTNGNLYTVIYSTVLVILVAAILSFVAMSLQGKQNENIKLETISKVLSAAVQTDDSIVIDESTDVLRLYADKITDAFFVDGYGKRVSDMNMGKENLNDIEVPTTSDLKRQNDLLKKIADGQENLKGDLKLPVFVFNISGQEIRVIPCYGAGLWGPVWGYIAVAADGRTIEGAIFDHKGETPGLGAKITEKPFYGSFKGKSFSDGDTKFSVRKGDQSADPNAVDAISGATITSQSVGRSINLWATYYSPYLETVAAAARQKAEEAAAAKEACQQASEDSQPTTNEEE